MFKTVEDEIAQYLGDLTLSGKNAVVLVEDKEDIAFWERLLAEFAPHLRPDFPSTQPNGKDNLRKFVHYTNKQLLICTDSDNDAFRQSRNSDWLSPRRPFIYQTYTHSRENHFIHPCNLQEYHQEKTGYKYDFERDFKELSEAFFPWLSLWLYFTDTDRSWLNREIDGFEKWFAWGTLKSIIVNCFEDANFAACQTTEEARNIATHLREKLGAHREAVIDLLNGKDYEYIAADYQVFEEQCLVNPKETLWYIQGHCAFDDIIVPYFHTVIRLHSLDTAEQSGKPEVRNPWVKISAQAARMHRDLLVSGYRLCLIPSQKCRFFDLIQRDMKMDFNQNP